MIVLDAPNEALLRDWMAAGHLPKLAALRERSAVVELHSTKRFSNEHCWIPMLTGRKRERWDHWLDHWDPRHYRYTEASIYHWLQAPAFYALGDRREVVTFDLTAPLMDGVQGAQVVGWATELNEAYPASRPAGLISELIARHGPDPKMTRAASITNALSGEEGLSYVVPSMYDTRALLDYAQGQVQSVERRTRACLDLLREQPWDLFLAQYSEIHTAGHLLWHLSQPHPLNVLRRDGADPMLEVYRAVDASIGELAAACGPDVHLAVLTLDQIVADCLESARVLLLPEFMYRWNFGGRAALAAGDASAGVPPPRLHFRRHWKHEVWDLRTPEGEAELESPAAQEARGDPMNWCPANWYLPAWPRMRAFAMPSVADGYIRLNVTGREAQGLVAADAFIPTCEEITRELAGLVDPRSGRPLVQRVIRVRDDPFDADPRKTPADLIVVFQDEVPVDAAQSPRFGRIGPVPYFRTGSHNAHDVALTSTMYVSGPRVGPGPVAGRGALEDVGAILLGLLGEPLPADFDGIDRLQ
ncbi:hypothetical protein UC35_03695 [Ramlibacter tataouinensis]|uniref:Uncharacterized protein n=1 Tax=Ramlibacter tataouinensis TaxID=94132 RepID=A0A127JVV2_9BURK|nr:hypothetical protein UC35_03695 [Ramlibacter tataouinensis]